MAYRDYMAMAQTLLNQQQQPLAMPEYQAPDGPNEAELGALRRQSALGVLAQMGGGPVANLGQALFRGGQAGLRESREAQRLAEARAQADFQRQMQAAQMADQRTGRALSGALSMAQMTKPPTVTPTAAERNMVSMYGPNWREIPEAMADFRSMVLPQPKTAGAPKAKDLRGEFIKQSKGFRDVRDAYGRVITAGAEPAKDIKGQAAKDMALVFGYMKMLDPGSTVREGEYASAANTRGIPDHILAAYNRAKDGSILTDAQRTAFVSEADAQMNTAMQTHSELERVYTEQAGLVNIDPRQVVIDYMGRYRPDAAVEVGSVTVPGSADTAASGRPAGLGEITED